MNIKYKADELEAAFEKARERCVDGHVPPVDYVLHEFTSISNDTMNNYIKWAEEMEAGKREPDPEVMRASAAIKKWQEYLTCNPGGVGHRWVKRLFIDRDYICDPDNPEGWEDPGDYTFIPATVEDNKVLLESSPQYVKMLAQMPENVRRAYRYGDWDALGGNYFPEFRMDRHVCEPFRIPPHWTRYRTIDYGLDMLAVYWVAVDEGGRSWVYREYTQSRLIVQDAAREILDRTLPDEKIAVTFAPPDLWSTQKDTGRTMAEIFMTCGVSLVRASNNRVQGHMMIKDLLAPMRDGKPGLMVFKSCKNLINDIRDIQADENNPDDCAKEPHELTHTVDSLRYYCVSRTLPGQLPEAPAYEEEGDEEDYDSFMTGGEAAAGYLTA